VLSPITILHKGYTVEILESREKDARNKPLISRAYEENGDDPFSLFNFGNSAICSGNAELGIEVLERMLATTTVDKLYFPLAYLMLGQTYCETLGDNTKALSILETGTEKFPKDAGLLFTKGQVLAKMNRLEEARELFEQALSLREYMAYTVMTDEEIFEWKIFYAMAGTYERGKDFDKAITFIDKALENKPTSFHLQRAKAGFLESVGRYYDAEVAFRRMTESDPARGQIELVNFLLRRRRYAQAIAIVENEINPESNSEMVGMLNLAAARAVIEAKSGDPMPYLDAARRLAPGNGNVISLLEMVFEDRKDTSALERLHAEEMDAPLLRPGDFVRRSYRLLALGRTDDARLVAEQGLLIEPRNPELRFNAAMAMLRAGDELGAERELGRVEGHSPSVYATAMEMRAGLALKRGDNAEALFSLQCRVAVMTDVVDAAVSGARMLAGGGASTQAISLLEEHVAVDSRVALELAGLLLQSGDIAGAGRVAAAALT
jgi:tetratricopeptide (TPR) repeat protein